MMSLLHNPRWLSFGKCEIRTNYSLSKRDYIKVAIEDDPFMLKRGERLGDILQDAHLSDWADIVQSTLNTAYQDPAKISADMIHQLEIAASAIAPFTSREED